MISLSMLVFRVMLKYDMTTSYNEMYNAISIEIEEHIGSYDDEPESVALMDAYIEAEGYVNDLSDIASDVDWYATDFEGMRFHHEIYLSDARKVEPERRKTVIRHPIKER